MVKERPISPHLQVYKPQLTSMLSILHRATGAFLALGTPFLVYWLVALAAGPQSYFEAQALAGHWLGQLLLAGWTFGLMYHLCNGIRHLFWDIGQGFELETLYRTGWTVLIVALALTAAIWFAALSSMGGVQ